jgi:hypothetical protein
MADRLLPHRVVLAAAIAYFVAGGVLALWFPSDGLDLYVSYVAGTASLAGEPAYARDAYLRAFEGLPTPPGLASARDLPFAYPPAWMPLAVALALLPWGVALAAWKLVNVLCLLGVVLLTVRLLASDALDRRDRIAVWSFALVLSPTISVVVLGQSSLVVVFLLLVAAHAAQAGRTVAAGAALALAMAKPQLALPLAAFLLLRGELRTLAVAAIGVAALTALGFSLAHADLAGYLAAVRRYTTTQPPSSHIAVGVASLLAHLGGVAAPAATAAGLAVGTALVAVAALARDPRGTRLPLAEAVPVVLYAAPLGFRCHGYDMVAVVPLFAWSRAVRTPPGIRLAIQALCLLLILPRAALRLGWETLAAGLLSADAFQLAERSFRSWVLLLLLPLVLVTLWSRAGRASR